MQRSKRQKYIMWSKEDEELFLKLLQRYGKDFKKYEDHFPNRSYNQIRCFYRNYNMRQQRDGFQEPSQKTAKPEKKEQMLKFIALEDLDIW